MEEKKGNQTERGRGKPRGQKEGRDSERIKGDSPKGKVKHWE